MAWRSLPACTSISIVIGALGMPAIGQPAARPLVSVSANLPEKAGPSDLGWQLLRLKSTGVKAMFLSEAWSDLEPREGARDLSRLAASMKTLTGLGFSVALTIKTLDTTNRTLPADLRDEPFSSSRMRARFGEMLQDLAGRIPAGVRWISLGNEVDIYLAAHAGEVDGYVGFLRSGREALKAAGAKAAVGVTTVFDGLASRPAMIERLHQGMDFVALTYYPLGPGFGVRPATDVAPDLGKMAKAAGGRPWILQEAGYPADPLLGSSEDKQAAFVDALFDAAARAPGLQMVNVFLLHDFTSTQVDGFLKYYGLPDSRFRAYLATLGLRKADGTPRKAYARFIARTEAWRTPAAP